MLTHAFHDFPERAEKWLETKAASEDGKTMGRRWFAVCQLWIGQIGVVHGTDWCILTGLPPALGGLPGAGLGPVSRTPRVLLCVTSTCSSPGKGTLWSKLWASVLWCDPSEMPLGLGGTSQISDDGRREMCSHCHLLSAPSAPARWSWEHFPECLRQCWCWDKGQRRELWCDVAGAVTEGNKWW